MVGRRSKRAGPTLQNFLNDVAMHVGQAIVAALEAERQARVIEAQAIEQRRVEVVDVDRIASDVEAVIVGLAEGLTALNPATGEPPCATGDQLEVRLSDSCLRAVQRRLSFPRFLAFVVVPISS